MKAGDEIEEKHEKPKEFPSNESSKIFLTITGIMAALSALVLVILLPVYFGRISDIVMTTNKPIDTTVIPSTLITHRTTNQPRTTTIVSTVETSSLGTSARPTTVPSPVTPNQRVNCIPDGNQTESKCEERGCVWSPSIEDSAAPPCFFDRITLYKLSSTLSDDSGISSVLTLTDLNSLNHFGLNFPELIVETTYITATTVRIKIYPDESRYEVPIKHPKKGKKSFRSLYRVQHSNQDGVFGVLISRRSTSNVIFDTSFGELMFSNQYLQISVKTASEYVYGFGEHIHSTLKRDMNWKTLGMFASQGSAATENYGNLNGVHPYFLCMETDGNAYGVLFVNSNAMDVTLQPTPAITYRATGGVLDFYVFLGPTPEEVTKQYTNIIGRPFLPPYWSLGFHLSRRGHGSLENLTRVVDRNIKSDLPYDVQQMDIDYMERGLDFTVSEDRYFGLGKYVSDLKADRNMRFVVALNPSISGNETNSYSPYYEGENYGVFIKDSKGRIAWGKSWSLLPGTDISSSSINESFLAHVAFPDFFHPNASKWWSEQNEEFHRVIDYDGLWIDMNEPTSFLDGSVDGCDESNTYENPPYIPKLSTVRLFDQTICMTNKQGHVSSGFSADHYNSHSLYGWSQSSPTLAACRQATGERCAVISSSTYPGSGKYTGHWIGNMRSSWEHLASSIIGILEFNAFGIPYVGTDVCGYHGDTTYELCVRWMQLGAFYPYFRNHNSEGSIEQDPAHFGLEFENDVKKAMNARYSLLPYLYTLFYQSHLTGSTVARPLMFEFPNDNKTYQNDRQFLWGSGLLISPTIEPNATTVRAYFPDSRWFDFFSGTELLTKGRNIELPAEINHVNLHIRGGTIIPTQKPAKTTYHSRQNTFDLIVALNENGRANGKLFWDNGVSIDSISSLEYTEIDFDCKKQLLKSEVLHSHGGGGNITLGKIQILGIAGESVTKMKLNGNDIGYLYDDTPKTVILDNLNLDMRIEFFLRWEFDNEWERIDCMPSMTNRPNRVSCQQRGCIWEPSFHSTDVPSCFFPLDGSGAVTFPSYSAAMMENGDGLLSYELSLKRGSRSIYGAPYENLRLDIEHQTDKRLHFKITDVDETSFEIPRQILNFSDSILSNESNASYTVSVNEDPFYMKIFRKSTGKLIFDTSVGPIVFEDRFLQLSTLLPSENVFGFGEHNHKRYRHDLNWRRWGIFSRDWIPVGPFNLYGHQSFFMSIDDATAGTAIGVYFHNANAMDVTLQPQPSVTYRTVGGVLDFYIFLAESQEALSQEYQKFVGLPMMPPYWSLGFQLSRWGYGSLERVKEVVNEMRDAQIPFDVQYGDIDYMNGSKDFTYDKVNYDGLPDFVDQLHEWGMRYVIILDPAIKIEEEYEPYERGLRDGVFVMKADGVTPSVSRVWPGLTHHADYTNPNTSVWWLDECWKFYNDTGIKYDALWVDMDEPANFLNFSPLDVLNSNCSREFNKPPFMPRLLWFRTGLHSRTLCTEDQQYLGQHYNLHSLYGHTMAKVTHETLESIFPNKRSFVITRSTFAGTGRYAGHWLGDNQSLWAPMAWAVVGMIEFNLFGIPYVGADVCGFMFDATAELCQRWMQVGAFYPFSRNHNANGRAGKELKQRGFWTTLEAPLDHINLHLRGGLIIPMQSPATTTVLSRQNPMSLLVALDDQEKAHGDLYWDDGESRNVGDRFLKIRFECDKSVLHLEIDHPPTDFSTNLFFERLRILGVSADNINSVLVYENSSTEDAGTEMEANFQYDEAGILTISTLQLRIDQPHIIHWFN